VKYRTRRWVDRAATAVGANDLLPLDPDIDVDAEGPAPSGAAPSSGTLPAGHVSHAPLVLAVALGGWIGAFGRYELELAWPHAATAFPAATFTINTSGAFLLGLGLTVALERFAHSRRAAVLRAFFGTGVLGAWTTMSSLAFETDSLWRSGRALTALLYAAATLVAGLLGTTLGIALGRLRRPGSPRLKSRRASLQ
jgi:CrcB protein